MSLSSLQSTVWAGRLPLEIRLDSSESTVFDQTDAYLISYHRILYLPPLLPRLHAFFSPFLIEDSTSIDPYSGYFTHQDVLLKWHLPLGLLYDIYTLSTSSSEQDQAHLNQILPFRLTLHFKAPPDSPDVPKPTIINPEPLVLHDSFINSVKEADFLRSGTARPIMSLSAADSKALWSTAQSLDVPTWSKIYHSLLPPAGQWRNVPLRVYIPAPAKLVAGNAPPVKPNPVAPTLMSANTKDKPLTADTASQPSQPTAQIKIVQSPIPTPSQSPVLTLGAALHALMPSLFPSRRTPIHARPLLHGAPVAMSADLHDLARWACYADGWVNVVVVLSG